MQKNILWLIALLFMGIACSKKSPDVAPVEIPERLEINVSNRSIAINDTAHFSLIFYDKLGNKVNPPTQVLWSSSDTQVATVSQNGIATGKGNGQTTIKATYNSIEATALLSVVADNNQVATVMLEASKEIKLNESITIQAVVKNNLGQVLTGHTIIWETDNAGLVSINAAGVVTGLGYGTVHIKAKVAGIESNPSMIQVIRVGNFANGSIGTAKLRIENGVLKLSTSSNFMASTSPPDLRIYLSNTNNATGAYEIATLSQRSGMQTWNLPTNVAITDYRYVLVWCKQYGGVYGLADLGN